MGFFFIYDEYAFLSDVPKQEIESAFYSKPHYIEKMYRINGEEIIDGKYLFVSNKRENYHLFISFKIKNESTLIIYSALKKERVHFNLLKYGKKLPILILTEKKYDDLNEYITKHPPDTDPVEINKKYLNHPYHIRIQLVSDESGSYYIAMVKKQNNFMSHGDTFVEAFNNIHEAIEKWKKTKNENSSPVPEPSDENQSDEPIPKL